MGRRQAKKKVRTGKARISALPDARVTELNALLDGGDSISLSDAEGQAWMAHLEAAADVDRLTSIVARSELSKRQLKAATGGLHRLRQRGHNVPLAQSEGPSVLASSASEEALDLEVGVLFSNPTTRFFLVPVDLVGRITGLSLGFTRLGVEEVREVSESRRQYREVLRSVTRGADPGGYAVPNALADRKVWEYYRCLRENLVRAEVDWDLSADLRPPAVEPPHPMRSLRATTEVEPVRIATVVREALDRNLDNFFVPFFCQKTYAAFAEMRQQLDTSPLILSDETSGEREAELRRAAAAQFIDPWKPWRLVEYLLDIAYTWWHRGSRAAAVSLTDAANAEDWSRLEEFLGTLYEALLGRSDAVAGPGEDASNDEGSGEDESGLLWTP